MNVQGTVNQRARNRYALLLAGIIAASLVIAGVILAGPAPSDRPVDANPFGGATTDTSLDTSPGSVLDIILEASPSIVLDTAGAAATSAQSGPRAELDTATTFAPQAPVSTSRAIELLGAEAWDIVSAGNVQQAMALLPASVQGQLGNPLLGPIRILVNFEGRTSSGYQPYGHAANFFSTNEGSNEVVLYPQQSVFTIVHELGHAYNLRHSAAGNYATVLIDPEMQSFMAIAGWQVLTPQEQIATMYDHSQVVVSYTGTPIWASMSRNDPIEDFANSFAMYFLSPADLGSRSPERYAWFAARFAP